VDPIPQWKPIDPSITQLGLRVRGLRRPTGRGLVVALIPASDDEDQIQAAIRSLEAQDAPPDLVVVDGEPDEALDIVLRELADEDAILGRPDAAAHRVGTPEGVLPGTRAHLCDPSLLDCGDELPLALRQVGYKVVSPKGRAHTIDLGQSWRDLYRRRRRANRNVSLTAAAGGTAGAAVLGSFKFTGPLRRGA
jgi:hypothetical protein